MSVFCVAANSARLASKVLLFPVSDGSGRCAFHKHCVFGEPWDGGEVWERVLEPIALSEIEVLELLEARHLGCEAFQVRATVERERR